MINIWHTKGVKIYSMINSHVDIFIEDGEDKDAH